MICFSQILEGVVLWSWGPHLDNFIYNIFVMKSHQVLVTYIFEHNIFSEHLISGISSRNCIIMYSAFIL